MKKSRLEFLDYVALYTPYTPRLKMRPMQMSSGERFTKLYLVLIRAWGSSGKKGGTELQFRNVGLLGAPSTEDPGKPETPI